MVRRCRHSKKKKFEEQLFYLFEEAISTEGNYDHIAVFHGSKNLVFYDLMTYMKEKDKLI